MHYVKRNSVHVYTSAAFIYADELHKL